MSWARFAIERLRKGETVRIRPRGHSMKPKVHDGDTVTVEPWRPEDLAPGDIVLVRVHGRDYLHLIRSIDGSRFLIGNNRGHDNGWVGPAAIHGKATRIER